MGTTDKIDDELDQLGLGAAGAGAGGAPPAEKSSADKRAEPRKRALRATRIESARLIGDPRAHAAGADVGFWYWLGIIASAPFGYADLNGVIFQKQTERLEEGTGREMVRIPVHGDVFYLTAPLAKRMLERAPLVFVRRFEDQEISTAEADAAIRNKGAPYRTRQRGFLITVPGAAEIEWRRNRGMPAPRYDYRETDEPVAKYLYAVLCADQRRPAPGNAYPPTLAEEPFEFPLPLEIGEPN